MRAITKNSRSLVEIVDHTDVKYGELTAILYEVKYIGKIETGTFWIFEDMLEFEVDDG